MRFITLSSDSSGNGYLLRSNSGEALIIEAGVKLSQVKKALDFDLTKIIGCIISHSHNDHAKYLKEYLNAGIRCYMNEDTKNECLGQNHQQNVRLLNEREQKAIGDEYLIKPFLLEHDVKNYGYLIHHYESGLICFITDTNYCHYTFKGLNNILIEANYSNEIIDKNLLDGTARLYIRNRILTYHMEFETTKEFLRANDLSKVNNIVLLHLSMDNSNSKQFKKEVIELTGKQVFIADPGLDIELNETAI
jgi:phosphoribosyl 1,2-cyclic phosphodiesterase